MEAKTEVRQTTSKNKESIEEEMMDLEKKINPKSVHEGLQQLQTAIAQNNPESLIAPIEAGVKDFEERVGRPMTYAEMRGMWG